MQVFVARQQDNVEYCMKLFTCQLLLEKRGNTLYMIKREVFENHHFYISTFVLLKNGLQRLSTAYKLWRGIHFPTESYQKLTRIFFFVCAFYVFYFVIHPQPLTFKYLLYFQETTECYGTFFANLLHNVTLFLRKSMQ